MSNDCIVYTRPDGGVSVVVSSGDVPVAELMTKVVPGDATGVRQVTTTDLPGNRNYRDAWDDSNPEVFVGVNVAKAREIAHGRRRAKRDEVFAPYLKITGKAAQGIPLAPNENENDAAAAMTAYKADVDDVAQVAIDAATTVEELEAAEVDAGIL